MIKSLFDTIVALLGIIILLPFGAIIGILIRVDSKGPILYKGLRAGRFGKPFCIYKFRTMIPNGEKPGGDTTALFDPRITRVGAFLRKYKIDELPQLLNVVKGEMSIVGPRPELLAYTNQYNEEQRCILDVKPGITDLSSIEFHSLDERVGSIDADRVFEENILPQKNQLRVMYVQKQSFWLDIKIILKTAYIILTKISKNT